MRYGYDAFGRRINPVRAVYGPGPEGQTCKGCVHLRLTPGTARRYWKCDLGRLSRGPATDHKVSFPACSRYEKEALHGT